MKIGNHGRPPGGFLTRENDGLKVGLSFARCGRVTLRRRLEWGHGIDTSIVLEPI